MKYLLLFILLYSSSVLLTAQNDSSNVDSYKLGVAIMPQYAIVGTMRLDVDITLKKHNVLTISPMFSFARNSSLLMTSSYDSYDSYYQTDNYPENISLTGGGMKVTLRHFFGDFYLNSGFYAGAGLHYRYSHVDYTKAGWEPITEDGYDYLVYGDVDLKHDFNQGGLDVIFGYQLYLVDNIYGDIFAGWGFRLSDFDEKPNDDDWNETIFDFGYSGYTPLFGMRIGVLF